MDAYPATYCNFPNTLLSWSKTGWDNQLVKCQTKKAGEMLTQVLWLPKGKGFFPQSPFSADSHIAFVQPMCAVTGISVMYYVQIPKIPNTGSHSIVRAQTNKQPKTKNKNANAGRKGELPFARD